MHLLIIGLGHLGSIFISNLIHTEPTKLKHEYILKICDYDKFERKNKLYVPFEINKEKELKITRIIRHIGSVENSKVKLSDIITEPIENALSNDRNILNDVDIILDFRDKDTIINFPNNIHYLDASINNSIFKVSYNRKLPSIKSAYSEYPELWFSYYCANILTYMIQSEKYTSLQIYKDQLLKSFRPLINENKNFMLKG